MNKKRIAIIGGGPSGLFVFKRLVESNRLEIEIEIFEKNNQLGAGLPYSNEGAGVEHITNVSGNEIPDLEMPLSDWVKSLSEDVLKQFNLDAKHFSDYKVLPRLLFGKYLSDQFVLLEKKAKNIGLPVVIHRGTLVTDIVDNSDEQTVTVVIDENEQSDFDQVIICSGHYWPKLHEGHIPDYFDSPYPPAKLSMQINHPVAIRGSSLTAIDAVRTLARHNGKFSHDDSGKVSFQLNEESTGFKIIMHSRNGLLPAVRFHLEDSHLGKETILSKADIAENRASNDGFLSLDFVFEKNFKDPIKEKEPEFYKKIASMQLEEFVDWVMSLRESVDSFDLLSGEYKEAEKSIEKKESVYWKEMLGVLSYTMNYPAKYFSAEDMLRLHKSLQPLISIVIAYVPQPSVEEILALHNAGLLELISVGDDSYVEPGEVSGAIYFYTDENNKQISTNYETYIDAVGQPHLDYTALPYKSLLTRKTVSPAKIKFRNNGNAIKEKETGNKKVIMDANGNYLNLPGIAINDSFQVLDEFGAYNERIFMMSVPFISGYNPDYSGLDFCDTASKLVVDSIILQTENNLETY